MNLNLLKQPVAEVCIGSHTIYLYPPTIGDITGFSEVDEDIDATEKFRMLLTLIASLSVPKDFREKRQPLADELIDEWSAEELGVLASAYAEISYFDKVRTGNADENAAPIIRHADEPAIALLDRLLNAEADRQRRIFEKINAQ